MPFLCESAAYVTSHQLHLALDPIFVKCSQVQDLDLIGFLLPESPAITLESLEASPTFLFLLAFSSSLFVSLLCTDGGGASVVSAYKIGNTILHHCNINQHFQR